jgi:putative membrane-bound dehydrogenase-like protein
MAFDEDGKLWVVEMRDYPKGPAKGQPPEGRVVVLEDGDGDGFFETGRVFADRLLFANGLMLWRGGVVVTAAPHIVYLKDTDGDGKADKREVLYEGFAAENPQLRVSHPVLGVDNWVYVANGLRGGKVRAAGKADATPISLGGMDFRFHLLSGRHEAISGQGQYGNAFDDWGNRFVCDNRHHLRHVVLESRYLKRNSYLAAPAVVEDISELEDGPLSSGGKIYPLSKNWTTSNLHAGRFTAACGVFIYRGALLPQKYRGAAFTCDPTGNLVHAEALTPHGATFRARPMFKEAEFLATPDDWCRPVFLAHGPDGAMYVVDMCRAVIEHPEFMPPELKHRPDLTLGKDRGRIWRVVPEGERRKVPRPTLSKATVEELVEMLKSPDAWWRTTAQRLLLERQDRSAIVLLRGLCEKALPDARATLHAVYLLDALGALDDALLGRLLGHRRAGVVEHAICLAESRLGRSKQLHEAVRGLARHEDARVRFQAALSLGENADGDALAALADMAARDAEDRWARIAVASSAAGAEAVLLARMLQRGQLGGRVTPGRVALLGELAGLVGARRGPAQVADVLSTLLALEGEESLRWQMAGLNGLAGGMSSRGAQLGAFLTSLPKEKQQVAERAAKLLAASAAVAADARRELPDRLAAVRLLAHVPWETARPALTRLVNEEPAQEIRIAAVRALAAQPRPEVAGLLLKSWRAYTPALRREVTEALLRQPDRTRALLKAVEARQVKPGDLDAVRVRQLLNHKNAEIREQARALLASALPADRKKVLEEYRAALKLKGDPQRGKVVFEKNCATCHRVAGIGTDVGPDISDTRTKTPDALLTDILNPNQAIDSNYVSYLITTKSGKSLTGIIASETAAGIVLKRAENQTEAVLRQDIEEIASSGVSLMPEGLEKTITVPQMADLLDFLKNWRYLDGAVPVK